MNALAVNVRGPFLCAREAVRRMSTRHGGRGGAIVNVGSGASQIGSPNPWVHYAATKGALDTMTIGLAKEVAAEGIRVNAVRPGIVDTEIHAARPPGQLEQMARAVPMGRIGSPDEIARTIVWLADEREHAACVAAVAPGGTWHRQGQALATPEAIAASLDKRPAERVTAHVITNLIADAGGPDRIAVRFLLTAFDGAIPAAGAARERARRPRRVRAHGRGLEARREVHQARVQGGLWAA